MTFGRTLRQARETAGYETAADFARIIGLEENRYRHYERGTAEPGFELLCKICQILDVEPNDLLPQGKRRQRPPQELSSPPSRIAS